MQTPVGTVHVRADPPGDCGPSWHDDDRLAVDCRRSDALPGGADGADCVVVSDGAEADLLEVVRSLREAEADVPVVALPSGGTGDALVVREGRTTLASVGRDAGTDDAATAADADEDGPDVPAYPDPGSLLVDVAADGSARPSTDRRAKIRALHDVAVDLVGCETDEDAFQRAMTAADELLEFDQSGIYVREDEKLVPVVDTGYSIVPKEERAVFGVDEGLIGHVYQTGESVLVEDARTHDLAEPTSPDIRSGVTVSLGEIGVFIAISDTPGAFDGEDLTLAEILGAHVTTAVERIRSENRTRRERNRLAALFENIPDAAAVGQRDGDGVVRIRRVNSAFERTFEVDGESVAGDPLRTYVDDGFAPDGDAAVTVEEIRTETADGVRDFLFRGFPAGDGDRYYGIFTDITARKARKRELKRKTERLEEFASIVSHDLRSPLSVASGWLEILREDAVEEQSRAIDNLDSTLQRMERLIEDLLVISREGWTVDDRSEVDGRAVVEWAWDAVGTPEASLECDWSGTVEADRDRLAQALENLFRNAVEHAGPDVHVRVAPLADDDGFAVEDDGPGIPAEVRDSLFEMGVTDDGGTGLGLTIVERIVAAHGWSIRVTDADDGGARFEIRFETPERSQ